MRKKSEHQKVDFAEEACISCYSIGKNILNSYSVDWNEDKEVPTEKVVGKVFHCFNCGHVWDTNNETGDIHEYFSEGVREYMWRKIGRKPPK